MTCIAIAKVAVEAALLVGTIYLVNSEPFQQATTNAGQELRDILETFPTNIPDEFTTTTTPPTEPCSVDTGYHPGPNIDPKSFDPLSFPIPTGPTIDDVFHGDTFEPVELPNILESRNIGGGRVTFAEALAAGAKWLGAGYKEIAPGVFRSADGQRQFRITSSDLTDKKQGAHAHFESIGSDGRTIIENAHIEITDP